MIFQDKIGFKIGVAIVVKCVDVGDLVVDATRNNVYAGEEPLASTVAFMMPLRAFVICQRRSS